jgi:small subunit ribosomal protein S27Ae
MTAKKDYYVIEGETLKRTKKHCPKCGPGVFLAEHSNRVSCGKCGYTEFKKK